MMNNELNQALPKIMHIDLNSCFATIEQQANPHLRKKPLVIAAYNSPGGCILSPSIEAKKLGIKVGMRVREAKDIYPYIIVRDPDPCLVRDVHTKFKKIFQDYSPSVTPKSIDEAVIDFNEAPITSKNLEDIAREIKLRMRKEIGEWISCSVGIAPNRFLAKLGASLHKPDGLDTIDYHNLINIYQKTNLLDLNGINIRYQARLNEYGIYTPLNFLEANVDVLQKQVFKSIVGQYWYKRLRGFEVDNVEWARKSYGQEYSLAQKTADPKLLQKYLMKLCEKMGRRLRKSKHNAYGIHLAFLYDDFSFWHKGIKFKTSLYSTHELFNKSLILFNMQPIKKTVRKISVSCYNLENLDNPQLSLFSFEKNKLQKVYEAIDKINDRYGEFVVTPATMLGMKDLIIERIAFGGTNELEDLYKEKN